MRALILAAGEGRRMQPVTLTTPKPLVEVAGTPMAVRQILALRKAGVEEIVLNVAHLGDRIVETLGDGSAWGVRLRYSVEGRTAGEALETLGGIAKALPMLDDGDGAFIVVAGDIVTDFDYSRLVRAGRALAGSDAVAHLVLAPNPSYHADGDMTLDELGLVRREPRTHTFSSLGVYGTSLFEGVEPVRAKLFPWLWQFCEAGRVTGENMTPRDDVIMATGRSDYPNQVNNVLGFPFIFRGALDVRATRINEEMKIAAALALRDLAKQPVPQDVCDAYGGAPLSFGREYIIPKPMDKRLINVVCDAVAKAAIESGVATLPYPKHYPLTSVDDVFNG